MASGLGPLTKNSFYGNKNNSALGLQARLARREREIQRYPAPVPYTPRLGGPSSHWQVFRTQQDAFNFARSSSQDLSVFSCESETFYENHGQRLFLVTSYEQFWHYYKQLESSRRHHYELIPEGTVCHLYFDLEFGRERNPDRQGKAMTEAFIQYVNHKLQQEYGIVCSESDIIQLDASTGAKFSQHLIYHLPNAAFKDNIAAGAFVQKICLQLDQRTGRVSVASLDQVKCSTSGKTLTAEKMYTPTGQSGNGMNTELDIPSQSLSVSLYLQSDQSSESDFEQFYVKDNSGKDVLFCDTGVYTRNRNFRLILSCKLGRNNALILSEQNKYVPVSTPSGISDEEQIFLDSLVANVQYHPGLRILTSEDTRQPITTDHKVPPGMPPVKRAKLELAGSHLSPYPEVDEFIVSRLTNGGVQGQIRQWSYFSVSEVLLYEITKNRWCENIQRQHKSNNIFYLVDLRHGVFYQKCHDPQCRASNFKSTELSLPTSCLPARYFNDEYAFDDVVGEAPDWDDIADKDLVHAVSMVSEASDWDDIADKDLVHAVGSTEEVSPWSPADEEDDVADAELVRAVSGASCCTSSVVKSSTKEWQEPWSEDDNDDDTLVQAVSVLEGM